MQMRCRIQFIAGHFGLWVERHWLPERGGIQGESSRRAQQVESLGPVRDEWIGKSILAGGQLHRRAKPLPLSKRNEQVRGSQHGKLGAWHVIELEDQPPVLQPNRQADARHTWAIELRHTLD